MKAIITGGGTGGHIYPALSISKALLKQDWQVLYVGSIGGLEGKIIPPENIPYREVAGAYLPRKLTPRLLSALLKTARGLLQARQLIKQYQPDLVLGTGGFVAGPVVLAASLAGIKTVIHEQNIYPGFTNRLLASRVDRIALNFKGAAQYFPRKSQDKLVVTGNPIREVILTTERSQGIKELDLVEHKKTMLVFGGSQGAQSINDAMIPVYKKYSQANWLQIIHLTGLNNYEQVLKQLRASGINLTEQDHYKILPYLDKMELAYAVADLIIYRAGATGLAEITAKGIPAILIPYPYSAENHQEYNARNLAEKGAAIVINQQDLTGDLLKAEIQGLFRDQARLTVMSSNSKKIGKPAAVADIIEMIKEIVDAK